MGLRGPRHPFQPLVDKGVAESIRGPRLRQRPGSIEGFVAVDQSPEKRRKTATRRDAGAWETVRTMGHG